jgi:hypothetical protein
VNKCPFCAEEIQDAAIKCKHCGSMLDGSDRNSGSKASPSRRSTFSALGLLGAFIAVVGIIGCCAGVVSGGLLVGVIGIVVLTVGASLGAKYKCVQPFCEFRVKFGAWSTIGLRRIRGLI